VLEVEQFGVDAVPGERPRRGSGEALDRLAGSGASHQSLSRHPVAKHDLRPYTYPDIVSRGFSDAIFSAV